ncbi:MAG: hypothetical protein WC750_04140 [Patescibacteria group bacterium]|jgi:hypothetical protein
MVMNKVLWTFIIGLFSLVLSSQAWADPTAIEKCADACARTVNVCLNVSTVDPPVLPDMAVACKDITECKGVDATLFATYSKWFAECVKNPGSCHQACIAPKVTPAPTGGTGQTPPPPPPKSQPAPMSEKDKCVKIHHGYYTGIKTEDGKFIERCYKISNAEHDVEALKAEVAAIKARLDNGQPAGISPMVMYLYWQVYQLSLASNGHTEVLNEARRIVTEFDGLKKRVEGLEKRMGDAEHNISVVTGKVATLEGRPGSSPGQPGGTKLVINRAGLPCWLGGYGSVNTHKVYDHLIGSIGGELGCSLFGSNDGAHSFVLGGGGGFVPSEYFAHKLVELHALAGYKYRGADYELLMTGSGKWFNTTTFETGTMSWYGVLPEARYLFGSDKNWFVGGRLGLGVMNVAPPFPPDVMANGRQTSFSANLSGLLGASFR